MERFPRFGERLFTLVMPFIPLVIAFITLVMPSIPLVVRRSRAK
jgi:hypothetical protein